MPCSRVGPAHGARAVVQPSGNALAREEPFDVPAPTDDEATTVAERLLGRRPPVAVRSRPAAGGTDSHVFRIVAGRDDLVLQIKLEPGRPIGAYFHARLQSDGIPVPRLVALDASGGPHGEACALWEWVDGTPAEWSAELACPYDEAELGELLRRIHDLRVAGAFGLLGDTETERPAAQPSYPHFGPSSASWPGYFHCDRAAREMADRGYLDPAEADLFACLPQRLDATLVCDGPHLLHMGDIMHNGNLLLDPRTGRIRAVLDYADSMGGDPRWELAWFDYYFGELPVGRPKFDLRRFRDAYGTHHDADDVAGRFYLLAILAFDKLRFYDPASHRGIWGIATLKRLLREVGTV